MNKDTEPIDTSDSPVCPDCGYIVFTREDVEYYCMECSQELTDEEVSHRDGDD